MPRPDRTRTLDEQVAAFRLQFDLYAAWIKDRDELREACGIKEPWPHGYSEKLSRAMLSLTTQYRAKGWDGSMWNWDEDWDGQLIRNCYALQAEGFVITQFYRKRKIMMKLPPGIKLGRMEIIEKIVLALGEGWSGLSFSKGIQVWWGPTTKARW